MTFKRTVRPTQLRDEGRAKREQVEIGKRLEELGGILKTSSYPEMWLLDGAVLRDVAKALRPHMLIMIERVFRKYCRAHNADAQLEELEWERFKKILVRNL